MWIRRQVKSLLEKLRKTNDFNKGDYIYTQVDKL